MFLSSAVHERGQKKELSAIEITSIAPNKMKRAAQAHLPFDFELAVISVPTSFNSFQVQVADFFGVIECCIDLNWELFAEVKIGVVASNVHPQYLVGYQRCWVRCWPQVYQDHQQFYGRCFRCLCFGQITCYYRAKGQFQRDKRAPCASF